MQYWLAWDIEDTINMPLGPKLGLEGKAAYKPYFTGQSLGLWSICLADDTLKNTVPASGTINAQGAVDATRQASNWRGNESKHANVEDHRPINEQGNDYGFDPGTIPFVEPDESLLKSQALNEWKAAVYAMREAERQELSKTQLPR